MKTQLIKTAVKGLYLTNEGKAYRKDLNIELKATTNGKVRYNGKLYNLQKLIDMSHQNTAKIKATKPKLATKKSITISELQKQGFKKTQISGLYVSKKGLCYNSVLKRKLTIRNGKTTINGKAYNVAKIILETFYKIPVRSGQINFKNGNNKDFSIENLEYKTTPIQQPPVPTDLIKCIRFYFEVDKKLNKNSLMTKYYLSEIIKKRGFNLKYNGLDFDLFLAYFETKFYFMSENQNTVFEKFNYTATNGKNAINKYLNLLISECVQDFENGFLKVQSFKAKPPTKTQKLKEFQKSVKECGFNIKIPLRKKSVKELLSDFKKHTKAIDLKIENLKKEPL